MRSRPRAMGRNAGAALEKFCRYHPDHHSRNQLCACRNHDRDTYARHLSLVGAFPLFPPVWTSLDPAGDADHQVDGRREAEAIVIHLGLTRPGTSALPGRLINAFFVLTAAYIEEYVGDG